MTTLMTEMDGAAAMNDQTTTQRIESVMEKYAPTGYDPASDDCTIPFAIQLVEKDDEIARLQKVLVVIRDSFWSDGEPLSDRIADLQGQAGAALESKMEQFRQVVNVGDAKDVPQEHLRDILVLLINYLKLEIVQEATPDYTTYDIRPRS